MIQIKGYEGVYFARKDGEIVSHKHGKEIVLKGGNTAGYRSYSLRINGNQKEFLGHRLIAEAFLENPENKPHVNHKDGNKLNNAVENLEWVTVSENGLHAYRVLGNKPWNKGMKKQTLIQDLTARLEALEAK